MRRTSIILFFILILAASLRLYKLGQIPEGFHADEAAFGYNAYSLLVTGKDEYGKSLPIIMKSFGDYKGALYSYLAVPFVYMFGLHEFSVRLPSALSGILLVYLTFVFVKLLTKKDGLALLSSLLCAIAPISVLISREAEPALLATDLILIGLICLFRWRVKGKIFWFITGISSFCLSLVTYFIPRLFMVVIIPLLWIWDRKSWTSKQTVFLAGGYVVIIGMILFLFMTAAGSRLGQVSVFSSNHVMLPLEEKIREDGVQSVRSFFARSYHNKPVEYGRFLLNNYMNYFSFDFLFSEAEQPRREIIPGMGVLYLVELPFLLFGIYTIFHKKYRWGYLMILWLITVPLLLSFATDETPNIHRFIINIIPVALIAALGIIEMPVSPVIIAILYVVNGMFFFHQLFIHQPVHLPFYRGFAYKELMKVLPSYYDSYKKIIVTKGNESPYIYFLFYGTYDPKSYQKSGSLRDLDYQGFGKYTFVPYDCPSFNEGKNRNIIEDNGNTLLIRRGGCVLGLNDKLLDTVSWRGGSEAFQLVAYTATDAAVLQQK